PPRAAELRARCDRRRDPRSGSLLRTDRERRARCRRRGHRAVVAGQQPRRGVRVPDRRWRSTMTDATVAGPRMIRTLAGVTLTRLGRGKALWIGAGFAALPLIYAVLAHSGRFRFEPSTQFGISSLLLAVLPAMF